MPHVLDTNLGSPFRKKMDLEAMIRWQLDNFCDPNARQEPPFYTPLAVRDPYRMDRPCAVHHGPPESQWGKGVLSGGAAWNNNARGGGDRTMISLRLPVLRMNTHGGTTNTATSCAHKLRPPGAVKFDKHSIHVIPKDKLTGPNLTGDVYAREVLRRVMSHSRQVVLERVGNGEKNNSTRS